MKAGARLALAAAVASVVVQTLGPIFVRKAGLSGTTFAFHRLWVAALVYLAVSVARRNPPTKATLRASAPGGALFALNVATFFVAVNNTTIANATVIGALQPVALLLLSNRLFGERVRRSDLVLTVAAIAGVAIVVFSHTTSGSSGRFGDLCAFVSMLSYAAYYIASKRARATLSTLEYQTSLTIVAFVTLAVVFIASGQSTALPPARSFGWIIAMVALPGTGHILTNFAHGHVRLSVLGVLTLFAPVGAVLLAWVWLGEPLNVWQCAGMAVVIGSLAAVVVANTSAPRVSHPQPVTTE